MHLPESLASDDATSALGRFLRPRGSSTGFACTDDPHSKWQRRAPGPSLGRGPVNSTSIWTFRSAVGSVSAAPPVEDADLTTSLFAVVYLLETEARRSSVGPGKPERPYDMTAQRVSMYFSVEQRHDVKDPAVSTSTFDCVSVRPGRSCEWQSGMKGLGC